MDNNGLKIKKVPKGYFSRLLVIFFLLVCYISIIIIIESIFNKNNFSWLLTGLILSFPFIYSLYIESKYLVEIEINNSNLKVNYLKYNKLKFIKTEINNIDVLFKNTTSRVGFNCELILLIDRIKIVIKNDSNWKYSDLKDIFVSIKDIKKEQLNEFEIDILEKINSKIKNPQ